MPLVVNPGGSFGNPTPSKQEQKPYKWYNDDLEELANNAPKFQYTPGIWDKIVHLFGGRSGEDKARDEFANANAMRLDQLKQLDAQQQYDSAVEQVQRLEDAGLNSDINGNITPGEAGEYDNQSQNAPETGETDREIFKQNMDTCINAIGSLASIVTTGVALYNDYTGILKTKQGISDDIYDFVFNELQGHTSVTDKGEIAYNGMFGSMGYRPNEGEEGMNGVTTWTSNIRNNPAFLRRFPTKWQQDLAIDSIAAAWSDVTTMMNAYGNENKTRTNIEEYGKNLAKPFNNRDIEEVKEVYKPIMDLEYKLLEITQKNRLAYESNKKYDLQAKRENSDNSERIEYNNAFDSKLAGEAANEQNKFHKEYYSGRDATQAAEAANASDERMKQQKEIETTINKNMENMMKGFNALIKKGGIAGAAAAIIAPIMADWWSTHSSPFSTAKDLVGVIGGKM